MDVTPIDAPLAGRQPAGPQPAIGYWPQSRRPMKKPSMRPRPDVWALAGPTDGSMIVVKRFCNDAGSRAQSTGASSTPRTASRQRYLLRMIINTAQTISPMNEPREPVRPMHTVVRPT